MKKTIKKRKRKGNSSPRTPAQLEALKENDLLRRILGARALMGGLKGELSSMKMDPEARNSLNFKLSKMSYAFTDLLNLYEEVRSARVARRVHWRLLRQRKKS